MSGCTNFPNKKKTRRVISKIIGARMMTRSKLHAEDPQILSSIIQNLVSTATWRSGFEHLWFVCLLDKLL
jgi:hypothetical protein